MTEAQTPSNETSKQIERTYRFQSPSLQRILAKQGVPLDQLDELPPKVVREIQRHANLKDYRSIELPGPTIRDSLESPLLRDLLVTRIGYHTCGAGHYIPRPEGSLDYILQYCVDGKGWCEIAGRVHLIQKNTVFLLPATVPHYYGAIEEDPWSVYWIHFTGHAAEPYYQLLQVTENDPLFHLEASAAILSAFEAIYRPMSLMHTYNHLVTGSGALSHFLSMINLDRCSTNVRTQTAGENIDKTVEFMKENLGEHYSLKQLSLVANMSPAHYSTVFKRRHDYSPIEYFNRLKVQQACQMLAGTTLHVKKISHNLGFEDPYYFSRVFKSITGVSPHHYRNGQSRSR